MAFANAFADTVSARALRRQVEMQEREKLEKQAAEDRKQKVELFKTALDGAKQAIQDGISNGVPEDAFAPIAQEMLGLAAEYEPLGIPGINRRTVAAELDIARSAPNREQQLAQKVTETRATAQATAEGTAAGTPVKPVETWTVLFNESGQPVAQRSSASGKIESHPLAPKDEADRWETILDEAGSPVAQRNTTTGEVKADPRAVKPENITPQQRAAAGFASRLAESNKIINEIGADFTGFASRGAGFIPRGLQSEGRQKFDQAKRNFINATLRRESGASIAPAEFESAELQYFPQPGDSDEVLMQKQLNRETVAKALELEAGGAFAELQASMPRPMVSILGRDVEVGSIVTNSRGERGRVEQDGSITILD